MKQILIIIFLIIPIAYGMEEQQQEKPKFIPGHRRNSFSGFNDKALQELTGNVPPNTISRQPSDLSTTLDPMNLLRAAQKKIKELNQEKKDLEEQNQKLTNQITTFQQEFYEKNQQLIQQNNTLIQQLKQPNKFMRFYIVTTLSYMIGTFAYFTYPWWSTYITLPHLLYYKR